MTGLWQCCQGLRSMARRVVATERQEHTLHRELWGRSSDSDELQVCRGNVLRASGRWVLWGQSGSCQSTGGSSLGEQQVCGSRCCARKRALSYITKDQHLDGWVGVYLWLWSSMGWGLLNSGQTRLSQCFSYSIANGASIYAITFLALPLPLATRQLLTPRADQICTCAIITTLTLPMPRVLGRHPCPSPPASS